MTILNTSMGLPPVVVGVFVYLNMPQLRQFSGSGYDPVKGRVLENTLKPRMDYNMFALQMMLKYPLGIGDFSSDIYSREANRFGYALEFNKGAPSIIHNGFLSAGTLYGITGMAAFIIFMLTGLMYYLQQRRGSTSFRWMAGLFLLSFLIINMTQDFSFRLGQVPAQLWPYLGKTFGRWKAR